MQFKNYQTRINQEIAHFCRTAAIDGPENAFSQMTDKEYKNHLEGTPVICIQSGTGSGKTLMAINSIHTIAEEYCASAPRIILFLVPTDALKSQTINDLQNPGHPNCQLLRDKMGQNVVVCDLELLYGVTPSALNNIHVVVTTVQSLNTNNPDGRRVYKEQETLHAHFNACSGQEVASVANVIAKHRPIIIVDEGHLNRTSLFNTTIANLKPQFVIEWTATPKEDNNELTHTTLAELKAENMIKFPMVVNVNRDGEAAALASCVTHRAQLESLVVNESRRIRPIALIGATTRGGEFPPEKIVKLLMEEHNIPKSQIAVATGELNELDGINLEDPSCQIRFVVTIQALREGWNCPWAYCYCSMREIGSDTTKQQFVGRVCRLPNATPFVTQELNQSYIFTFGDDFESVVQSVKNALKDCGFTDEEVNLWVAPPAAPKVQTRIEFPVDFHIEPNARGISFIREEGKTILVMPEMPYHETVAALENLEFIAPDEHKPQVAQITQKIRNDRFNKHAPSEAGENFPPVPQLYLGEKLIDGRTFLQYLEWDKVNLPTNLGFSVEETGRAVFMDVDNVTGMLTTYPAPINTFETVLDESDKDPAHLIGMVSQSVFNKIETKAPDLSYSDIQKWVKQVINKFIQEGKPPITDLLKNRNRLAIWMANTILKFREKHLDRLFMENVENMNASGAPYQIGDPKNYRPTTEHPNAQFLKHFFPRIGELNTEEEKWARKLDNDPQVKWWIRNMPTSHKRSTASGYAFFLPLPEGRFFPDFVVLLNDGTIRLDEYKGEHLLLMDDTHIKDRSGNIWKGITKHQFQLVKKEDLY